jgi:6,7-dimethyl-8-ribityllumazine synthase
MAEPRRKTDNKKGDLKGARFVVVEARFYDDIADALLAGAQRALDEAGAVYDIISVPGALEIPAAVAMALDSRSKRYQGAIALGCVIRGETFHFEIVAEQSARALMDLSVSRRTPVGNGILTVDTQAQAWARANVDEGDKGGDAARAALAMLRVKRSLEAKKR